MIWYFDIIAINPTLVYGTIVWHHIFNFKPSYYHLKELFAHSFSTTVAPENTVLLSKSWRYLRHLGHSHLVWHYSLISSRHIAFYMKSLHILSAQLSLQKTRHYCRWSVVIWVSWPQSSCENFVTKFFTEPFIKRQNSGPDQFESVCRRQ